MNKEIVFEKRKLEPIEIPFREEESYIEMAGKTIAKQIDDYVFSMLEERTGLPRGVIMANTEEALREHREKHPEKWITRSRDDGKL